MSGMEWVDALDAELAAEAERIGRIARLWRGRPMGSIGTGRQSGVNLARSVLARHVAEEKARRESLFVRTHEPRPVQWSPELLAQAQADEGGAR